MKEIKYIVFPSYETDDVSIIHRTMLLRHHLMIGLVAIIAFWSGATWVIPFFIGASISSIIMFFRNLIANKYKHDINQLARLTAKLISQYDKNLEKNSKKT